MTIGSVANNFAEYWPIVFLVVYWVGLWLCDRLVMYKVWMDETIDEEKKRRARLDALYGKKGKDTPR